MVTSLLPVAVLAVINIREARSRIFADETDLLAARADQLSGELDHFNQAYEHESVRLASAPEALALLAPDARKTSGADAAIDLDRLRIQAGGDHPVRAVGFVDPEGRVRAATAPALVGSEEGHPYVARGLAGPAISDPYVSELGAPTIAYASPVIGPDRAVLGVAVMWVDAEALWHVASRFNGLAGEGSFAAVFDRDGTQIAHTSASGIAFRPGSPQAETVDRMVTEHRQLSTTDWTVFYMVPRATLIAPITSLTIRRGIVSIAIGIAALLTGIVLAAMLIRPVRALAKATRALAAGDLSVRIVPDRVDELGELGHAFDAMAARLEDHASEVKRSHEDLEQLVSHRTGELAASNRQLRDEIAERRRAEVALRESEQRYREIYEHSPDMYLQVDIATTRIVDCNQTLCTRLGYQRSELIGEPGLLLYHPDADADLGVRRVQFLRAGHLHDVERTLRCKDGTAVEVSLNVSGVRDDAGTLVAARGVFRDITARKQGERDRMFLIQLADRLRSSTDIGEVLERVSIQLGEYLQVSRCVFVEIDVAADRGVIRRDYAVGVPSLAGEMPVSVFGGAILVDLVRGITTALEDAEVDPRTASSYQLAYEPSAIRAAVSIPLLHDGAWVAVLTVCTHERRVWEDREIALVKLVAERVWQWIEHLKALEQLRDREVALAVRRSEERFQTLVESVEDYAIFMLDAEGNIATWTAGAERLNGYARREVLGQSFATFYSEEDLLVNRPGFVLEQARVYGRYEEERWLVRKDGSRFWGNVVITAMRGPGGELEGFAEIARDFTERRAQDEALRTKQVALSQSLREREVLLQEVHHRVKNNLQVISSLIHMQTRRIDDDAAREALEECQTRVLAIALIHEQLYQAKDYSQVQFSEYVRNLAGNVFHATGTSQTAVSLELAIEQIPLSVERAIPCGLVVNELITNALKHGFKDGRTGTIRVELRSHGERELSLTVQDDGVGLPAGFDIERVESMGLRLVSTLSEQLDARLVIRGDHGASFQLLFPVGADARRSASRSA
ncbi:MAG TPA: PAS domain S-box protein [Kofleriaceae bacterium]|nr:PAS domain S-box protein [Kofleriaceae bacterium]